ncbi:MipA/OmpV family protein [Herbaspirillum sp. WKF16]|uniref:MipA/OmpV family protein n=1 Tax=Herbaspirillum sp. WKF16 TaxID=3028312 RepID=UPI0023A94248|nr:MipA/OmpV family protein [Herbaspirillum sp. WKF16]WDZ94631.1 MipA/OmpV family protein [Herbaspirillum sp. WKF16]
MRNMLSPRFPRLFSLASLTGAAIMLAATAAHAQQAVAEPGAAEANAQASRWALGAGVGIERSPYAGYGNKTRALPLLMYNGRYFSFAGTTADLKLGAAGPVGFTLRARYADDGYEGSDAPILNGMDKRKGGFWIGASALWRNPYADLSLEWLTDASGNSHGQTVKLQAEHRFTAGRFTLSPYLGVNWMSSDYVDYYFGVRQNEATARRAAYQGSSTANLIGGLRTDYSLTSSQSMFLDLRVTRYGSGITDSPLVDRSNSPSARLGYLYRF